MKKIDICILSFLGLLFLGGCKGNYCYQDSEERNAVKLGMAKVVVDVEIIRNVERGDSVPILNDVALKKFSENKIGVATASLFSKRNFFGFEGLNITKLNKEGNRFIGDIPVECLQQMGLFCFMDNRDILGGIMLPLSQNDSTILSIQLKENGEFYAIECHNSQNLTGTDLRVLGEIFQQALDYDTPHGWETYIDNNLYDRDLEDVRRVQLDSVWPIYRESSIFRCKTRAYDEFSFRGMGIPRRAKSWVINDLKISFADELILRYTNYAMKKSERKVINPPMKAYSFLDSINYSSDVFLITPVSFPQRGFLEGILQIPGNKIKSIDETPIEEWQNDLREILAPAIKEPTKLLMDLLAGMSYILQIETGEPLSEKQIRNINKGFTDDIGKIVLSCNAELTDRAGNLD